MIHGGGIYAIIIHNMDEITSIRVKPPEAAMRFAPGAWRAIGATATANTKQAGHL